MAHIGGEPGEPLVITAQPGGGKSAVLSRIAMTFGTVPESRVIALRTSDGRPAGLVHLADLARVPERRRAELPVHRIAIPSAATTVVESSRPVADVADAVSRVGSALVVDHGVLVGLLCGGDVARAVERRGLQPDRPDARLS
ncbi:hypothetical protein ACPPVO_21370 [Dactylosporangium sp. McL0621]|uniref:hypothetical protein n=1 Tax=Dactylosporangium sp. McL0621 TaxID=3415678 RepID=UPI003CEC8D90